MGPVQWLQQQALLPGDPPVDRARKEIVAGCYTPVGVAMMLAATAWTLRALSPTATTERVGLACIAAGAWTMSLCYLPAGLYVVRYKRVSRALCEYPVVLSVVALVLSDVGLLLNGWCSVVGVSILLLDALLAGDCRNSTARGIVWVTTIWTVTRKVLEAENVHGDCKDTNVRFSPAYIIEVLSGMPPLLIVLFDFYITRGFVRSMKEQKALVEASILVTELAAVNLSKYRTDAVTTLLRNAEADGLPPGLRAALSQLVANLAEYRPYLPQACFSESLPEDSTSADSAAAAEPLRMTTTPSSSLRSSTTSSTDTDDDRKRLRAVHRRVAVLAVNSRAFLAAVQAPGPVAALSSFLHHEVDGFVRRVAAERGVVDVVSGDRMFANFNASRLCTTCKVGAARVAWGMAGPGSEAGVLRGHAMKRTAAVCCGIVVCGDFGTSELRRFMLLGAAVNTIYCLERVASQMGTMLVDGVVGADADVCSSFFTVLVERLAYAKLDAVPFSVWQLAGGRGSPEGGHEWMYELEQLRNATFPFRQWNERLQQWLCFGRPFEDDELAAVGSPPFHVAAASVTSVRQQSWLVEATVTGGTVAFTGAC